MTDKTQIEAMGIDKFNERLAHNARKNHLEEVATSPAAATTVLWSPEWRHSPVPPRAPLRLMVGATPRTGNNWLTHLLSRVYDIPLVLGPNTPDELPDDQGSYVFYQHFLPTEQVLTWGSRNHVQFVTLTRHPADVFLSLYKLINDLEKTGMDQSITSCSWYRKLIGRPLSAPEVFDFIVNDFDEVHNSLFWIQSGRALKVRYEDLNMRTEETLLELTRQIRPVSLEHIRQAIAECTKDKMRQQSDFLRINVRKGSVGEGREKLSPRHLELIRCKYADELETLGYQQEWAHAEQPAIALPFTHAA
jgi:hypothetical protein